MKRLTYTAAALIFIAAPLVAQDGGQNTSGSAGPDAAGTITGTLDLVEAVWYVSGIEDGSNSFWQRTDDGMRVQFVGYPSRTPETADGALIVTFAFDSTVDSASPENVRVVLLPGDPGGAEERLSADDLNTSVFVSAVNVLGGDMVIAGSLSAVLTPGNRDELIIETDEAGENARTLDVDFQATIYRNDPS